LMTKAKAPHLLPFNANMETIDWSKETSDMRENFIQHVLLTHFLIPIVGTELDEKYATLNSYKTRKASIPISQFEDPQYNTIDYFAEMDLKNPNHDVSLTVVIKELQVEKQFLDYLEASLWELQKRSARLLITLLNKAPLTYDYDKWVKANYSYVCLSPYNISEYNHFYGQFSYLFCYN